MSSANPAWPARRRSSARKFSRPPSRKNASSAASSSGRQGRSRLEPRVVAVLSGQHGERDVPLMRKRRERLDAIAPPIETAEQPHHDHFGVARHLVDPKVDRHRMAQIAEMREPNARQADRAPPRKRQRDRRGRYRRTTRPRCRPASGRDRAVRRCRRGSPMWSGADAWPIRATPWSPPRDRGPSVRSPRGCRPAPPLRPRAGRNNG